MNELLKREIALLPDSPGVYLMKDDKDFIIYIGKAKNLKKRVSQYFLRPQSGKVAAMVSHVDHFDTILVGSEKEAFILEMNLIQTHYPRYNIIMMDDSHYPYIALRRSDAFLSITRKANDRRYLYFGPFPSSHDAYETINLLNGLYPTRKCASLGKKECLYFHMGECLAPCVRKIEPATYQDLYEKIKRFLKGDTAEVITLLKNKMAQASSELRYEDAAEYKKKLEAIEATTSRQNVESSDKTDRDVIGFASRDGYFCLSILLYRRGILLGKESRVYPSYSEADDEEKAERLAEFYSKREIPTLISTSLPSFANAFSSLCDSCRFIVPKEGRLLEEVSLAALNAKNSLDQHFQSARLEDDNLALLEELGTLLGVATPLWIELFDNSHLQGSSPVGASIAYINGEPAKKLYRHYHLGDKVGGDDFHSMEEIVYRRYRRLLEEGRGLPNLVLADGGMTQVEAAKAAIAKAGASIPVYGLAKNDRHQTEGLVNEAGTTYPIERTSPLFFLLMRMQDEVHRFAITFHRKIRGKNMKLDLFSGVEGLGEIRKEKLRKHFPTLDSLKTASLDELKQLLPEKSALSLFAKVETLRNSKGGEDEK